MSEGTFRGGMNIAMKIPKAEYDATVAFYRDTLGFELEEQDVSGTPTVSRSQSLAFGPNTLWLDCVHNYSRPDVWLELFTPDLDGATAELATAGCHPCDEVEPLESPGFRSHWIKNPAGIVHLLAEDPENTEDTTYTGER